MFEKYMIEMMLGVGSYSEENRQVAYRECLRRMGKLRPAAVQTIQKWFGIHGHSQPGREVIFELGFSLQCSAEEVSDMLKKGAMEPDFQMNDYREVIFLYGYENQMAYEECLTFIEQFQCVLPLDHEIQQHNHTDDILEARQEICQMNRREFMEWMKDHAKDFKGYSMTVLSYLQLFKSEILEELRQDAALRLDECLKDAGYYQWEAMRGAKEKNRRTHIRKYVDKVLLQRADEESRDLARNIMELREMAYVSPESNTQLLAELYTSSCQGKRKRSQLWEKTSISLMDDKYLSELLNIACNKEKQIQLSLLLSRLRTEERDLKCPEWAWEKVRQYGYPQRVRQSTGTVCIWLEETQKKQSRRCRMIHRCDLLPLIFYVAQKRYSKYLNQGEEYDCEKARNEFRDLANRTLHACHMEPLNPEIYKIDEVLWACYDVDEMWTLPDVLERLDD